LKREEPSDFSAATTAKIVLARVSIIVTKRGTGMILKIIGRMKNYFQACCSSLKSYVLTRHTHRTEGDFPASPPFTDKNTFYAWQRNHMANERTFLSWCRTGISLIAFGFVIERFDILIREMQIFATRPGLRTGSTRYIGLTAFTLGAFIVVLAGWRFFYIRRHINREEVEFSVLPDIFLMGAVFATVLATFVFFAFAF
jgi:putative membrane protein